ncbi:hypothetical protein K6M90_28885 [Rhizobium sp. 9T]|uniref:hypothetical protein n=1 Tax=Rhizobium croatiense TaxID=2867516 RepID=UPI001C9333B0|nr:hypothetical protein [Rhizobium croatiense]MBY4611641.1 hypothetical protein [Rhizobium croatiense]
MTRRSKLIVQEVALSAVLAAGTVIGIPKLTDPNAAANYPLAIGVFLMMSAAFVAYELITGKPS